MKQLIITIEIRTIFRKKIKQFMKNEKTLKTFVLSIDQHTTN